MRIVTRFKRSSFKTLVATERSLKRNKDWGERYNQCILDMIERGVVWHVPKEELESYQGVVNCLPHLAAHNLKSKSTPIWIVFDATWSQGGGPSLNDLLAKRPDRYLNNLAAAVTGFRDGS